MRPLDPEIKKAGRKLRALREKLGLRMADVESESQRLARLFGKSRLIFHTSALSEMEVKGRPPSLHRAYVLSLIYETDVKQIFSLYGLPDLTPRYINEAAKLRQQRAQEARLKRQRICEYCGKEFEVRFPSVQAKFCSTACVSSARLSKTGKRLEHKLRKAYAEGTSVSKLAKATGLSRTTIYNLANRMRLQPGKPKKSRRS